jgi:hypothetical protein
MFRPGVEHLSGYIAGIYADTSLFVERPQHYSYAHSSIPLANDFGRSSHRYRVFRYFALNDTAGTDHGTAPYLSGRQNHGACADKNVITNGYTVRSRFRLIDY